MARTVIFNDHVSLSMKTANGHVMLWVNPPFSPLNPSMISPLSIGSYTRFAWTKWKVPSGKLT